MIQYHHAFRVEYKGLSGILFTDIGVSEIKRPKKKTDFKFYKAVWDTGATNTVISPRIAKDLNLKPVDKTVVNAVNGKHIVNRYLIRTLSLPNRVAFEDLTVTEGTMGGNIDILIGMDLITKGDFHLSHYGGKTIFSFALPPHKNIIDLLEKTNKVNERLKKKARKHNLKVR